jgi:ABC-2 type transport system permease protein
MTAATTDGPQMIRALPYAGRPGPARVLGECGQLTLRSLKHVFRDPEQLFQMVTLPVILLLLFRFLLGGAIDTGGPYVNYVVAGLMVISMAFGSTSTVIIMTDDLRNGIVERLRSMPIFNGAVLVGHVVSSVVRSMVSTALMIVVGFAVGFRPTGSPARWAAAIGILLLFSFTLSWISVLLGLIARSPQGASGLSSIVVFLPYLTSALVPEGTVTPVLRAIITYQPMSPVIDAFRKLTTDAPVGNSVWLALGWWIVILAVTVPLAVRRFRRRVAILG